MATTETRRIRRPGQNRGTSKRQIGASIGKGLHRRDAKKLKQSADQTRKLNKQKGLGPELTTQQKAALKAKAERLRKEAHDRQMTQAKAAHISAVRKGQSLARQQQAKKQQDFTQTKTIYSGASPTAKGTIPISQTETQRLQAEREAAQKQQLDLIIKPKMKARIKVESRVNIVNNSSSRTLPTRKQKETAIINKPSLSSSTETTTIIGSPASGLFILPLAYASSKENKKLNQIYEKPAGPKQPPPYIPGEATSNVLKEYGAMVMQPRNIFGDIFHSPESSAKINKHLAEQYQKKIVTPLEIGPTVLGSTIEQAARGETPKGTGRGTLYDIESAAAEAALILVPGTKVSKIVNPASKVAIPVTNPATGKVEAKVVARSLTIGPKEKPLITKTDRGFTLGAPKAKDLGLEKMTPVDRGFEIGTRTPLEQRILTSDDTLNELARIGFQKTQALKIQKEVAPLVQKAPVKIIQPLPKQPVQSLNPGRETESFIKTFSEGALKKDTIKGGLSQIVQTQKGRKITSDIDVDVGPTAKAEKKTKQFIEGVELDPGREFINLGTKVKIKDNLTGKKPKVAEFLTDDETTESSISGLSKNAKTIFGQKLDFRPIKTEEGVRVLKLTTQTQTKGVSVGSMQGKASIQSQTKKLTKDPDFLRPGATLPENFIGPPVFRLKDVVDDVDNLKQLGLNYLEKGKLKQGTKLIQKSKELEDLYPEIDFDLARKSPSVSKMISSNADESPSVLKQIVGSDIIKSSSIYASTKSPALSASPPSIRSPKSIYDGSKSSSSSSSSVSSKSPSSIKSPSSSIVSSKSSPKINDSVLSNKSPSSKSSPVSIKSPPSIKSPSSVKSPPSPTSVLSPSSPLSKLGPSARSPRIINVKTSIRIEKTRKALPAIITLDTTKKKPRRTPRKPRADFLGNVPVDKVIGVYGGRSEIIYGRKKTSKLVSKDLAKNIKAWNKKTSKSALFGGSSKKTKIKLL